MFQTIFAATDGALGFCCSGRKDRVRFARLMFTVSRIFSTNRAFIAYAQSGTISEPKMQQANDALIKPATVLIDHLASEEATD
jgi:hypothetical protein